MKRIDVFYGGREYTVSDRDLIDLQREIQTSSAQGSPGHWLKVNIGEGNPQPALLFVAAGAPIALVPVDEGAPVEPFDAA